MKDVMVYDDNPVGLWWCVGLMEVRGKAIDVPSCDG